ncbi:hypothetical protein AHF37_00695 [Paragonimus kellicotti]|nr:hypothetical protein AHF37_00695 [Paragonimus kellicotti]
MRRSNDGIVQPIIEYTDFEKRELVDLLLSGLNDLKASAEFHRRHPKRPKPSRTFLWRLMKRFRETGSVETRKIPRTPQNREFHSVIVKMARENPHLTNLELAAHFGISLSSLVNILFRFGFQRTKLDIHQRTSDEDRDRRVAYCKWFQKRLTETPTLPDDILFSDEAVFHLHGVVNHHNLMQHSSRKTQVAVDDRYQYNLKILVWCGIHNQTLVGPYFFDGDFNSQTYLQSFTDVLKPYLDSLSPDVRNRMFFQHDAIRTHCAKLVQSWLDENFPSRWIGKNGKIDWPPRSFDLTPMTFFLWDYLKSRVFDPPPKSLERLKENIRTVCGAIDGSLLSALDAEIKQRVTSCLENAEQ